MVGFPDPFGRLVGKRFRAGFFLDSVVSHGTHGCNYLLTVNMDMDPLDGFKVANWDAGFGDFVMQPDGGAFVTDSHGMRYAIPSIAALDPHSRRLLDRKG